VLLRVKHFILVSFTFVQKQLVTVLWWNSL